jgi:hypothetical protein
MIYSMRKLNTRGCDGSFYDEVERLIMKSYYIKGMSYGLNRSMLNRLLIRFI